MKSETVRFWPRVGMYVTQEFAEEWIERLGGTEGIGGRYLEDDIEEYVRPNIPRANELRREIEELFSSPFEEGELGEDIQAIIDLANLENSKVERVKELKSQGHTLEEAKEMFQKELDAATALILGIEDEEEGAEIEGGLSSSDESE